MNVTAGKTKKTFWRGALYALGLALLACGIILCRKSTLGAPPLVSVPACVSTLTGWDLGALTFLAYALCVLLQWAILGRRFSPFQWLQLPVSFAVSGLVSVFDRAFAAAPAGWPEKLVLLAAGIVLTGAGAALIVDMRVVPCPPDGLAHAVAESGHIGLGLAKNLCDAVCVAVTVCIGLLAAGRVTDVGVGTLCAMVGVGRVIAGFNRLLLKRLERLAGL